MTNPDQGIEDTREPDTRGDAAYEKLVDAFEAGKLDAEFVAWAVKRELKRTGDAIAETLNDKAARTLYQDFAADYRHVYAFNGWLAHCAPELHADEIATILREEDASSAGRDDDHGWCPVKEFLTYWWERAGAER